MVSLLVISVAALIAASIFCSMSEAAIYSVPIAFVRPLAQGGSRTGKILLEFKEDISKPISVILILNTTANVAGASLAGWAAGEVFGESALGFFTAGFTLVVLYFGEIFPKTLGSIYCRQISQVVALPVHILGRVFSPLIWISEKAASAFSSDEETPTVSTEEMLSLTEIGTEEGELDRLEGQVITNVIGLDEVLVKDVLTPRVVVERMDEATRLGEIGAAIHTWPFSRIPIFSENEPEHLTGYVLQRDIYRELLSGGEGKCLKDIARPLKAVPELMTVDKLLLEMLDEKRQISAVVDEHGGLAGIVTLEDIIEEVIGHEVVDEYDRVSDMRSFAKTLRIVRTKKNPQ